MSRVWLVLAALWRIVVWWAKREEKDQVKREALQKEVSDAIKTGDTRRLHRAMSGL